MQFQKKKFNGQISYSDTKKWVQSVSPCFASKLVLCEMNWTGHLDQDKEIS
jgi:hypothetical protein